MVLNGAGGGVPPARRDQPSRLGVNDGLLIDAPADHRDALQRVLQSAVDRPLVRRLDLLPQVVIVDRPDRAD